MTDDAIRERLFSAGHQEEIKILETVSPWKSVFLYLKVYLAILVAIMLGMQLQQPLMTLVLVLFIAGRQHSLYILSHDASHYSLFKSRKMNQMVATVFSNWVMFHHPEAWSFIQWRRVHVQHHAHLFTVHDPNYVGRQQAGDTEHRHSIWELVGACLIASPQAVEAFFIGKQDYVKTGSSQVQKNYLNHLRTLFFPFHDDRKMEGERRLKWAFFLPALCLIHFFDLWQPFLLFWLLPMYTFYPMILKFHDLTEHHWEEKSTELHVNTRSVERSFLMKILLSCLPRGFHQEHHLFPRVPVVRLPKVHELLQSLKK